MNTRYKNEPGPLSQQRYMSSPEFAELHGISGVATSARAAILLGAAKREFIWWLQGLSLAEGGLKRVTRELLEMFPDRLRTPCMEKANVRPEKIYPGKLVEQVELDLELRDVLECEYNPAAPKKGEHLIQLCREAALTPEDWRKMPTLEQFLVDLCINPRISFALPGQEIGDSQVEQQMAVEKMPELSAHEFKPAKLIYFKDIIGALWEYKALRESKIRENFQPTAISRKIWETLDYALASHGMVVLDGLEGRGKTEAVKAWCETHLGEARFVSLKGITSKTTVFREIAKALGIASSYTRTATEMQARIEDVLKRSKLLLVLDEAHFLFNQSRRMYSRPELIDWIDTAICNCGVGCALVTTPQFIVCMTRAADQVEWNFRQFRRRVKRWEKLPPENTEDDIRAVARNVFKKAPAAAVDQIVGYALLSKRDLSAVGDVVIEVRAMLGTDDLSNATLKHVHSAIYDFLLPSDKTFLEGMAAARNMGRKPRLKRRPELPEPAAEFEPAQIGIEHSAGRGRGGLIAHESARRASVTPSLVEA